MAIRAAIGESRARLAGSVLLESLVLGVAGGIAGLLLALGVVRLLIRFDPQWLPRLGEISIDTTVVAPAPVKPVAGPPLCGQPDPTLGLLAQLHVSLRCER